MALVRTFINRGKRPLEISELKPNDIYAVRFVLTSKLAAEWQVTELEQWGLVMLDASRHIRRHWNLTQPHAWSTTEVSTGTLKLFRTTVMERQFAAAAESSERYQSLYDETKQSLADLQYKVWLKNHRLIQRFANWLMREK